MRPTPLQHAMFREIADKALFEQAQTHGLTYLDALFDRNVFPTEAALHDLQHFEEPLWATMKYLGRWGMEELVDTLCARAAQFASALRGVDGFRILNDVVFNQVLVCCETDALRAKTFAYIQELRECWVGGSSFQGRKVIRMSVSSWATTADDI